MSNSASLLSIPLELHEQIFKHVSLLDLRLLSRTCSFYFQILAPQVYKELILREDSCSGKSILAIAASPRATLVKKITFRPRDPRSLIDEAHNPGIILSQASRKVLANFDLFACVKAFELYIDWEIDKWYQGIGQFKSDSHNIWQIPGYSGCGKYEYIKPEEEEPWRKLLNDVLLTIAGNDAQSLDSLVVKRLPPLAYTALESPQLRRVLNKVRNFQLVLLGAGGQENNGLVTTLMQNSFITDANQYIFPELENVETLHVQGASNAIVGEAEYLCELEVSCLRFSRLRSLALDYYMVGPDLAHFLVCHFENLERVVLDHCYSENEWHLFFNILVKAQPQKLIDFQVLPEIFTWCPEKWVEVEHERDARKRYHVREAEQKLRLAALTGARTFPRAEIDGSYGTPDLKQCCELIELNKGRSLAVWTELQDIVKRNRTAMVDCSPWEYENI